MSEYLINSPLTYICRFQGKLDLKDKKKKKESCKTEHNLKQVNTTYIFWTPTLEMRELQTTGPANYNFFSKLDQNFMVILYLQGGHAATSSPVLQLEELH